MSMDAKFLNNVLKIISSIDTFFKEYQKLIAQMANYMNNLIGWSFG